MKFGFKTLFLVGSILCTLSACTPPKYEKNPLLPVKASIHEPAELSLSAEEYFLQASAFYEKEQFEQSAPLLRKAADLGHFKAQFLLGILYERGDGVPQSFERAEYWMQKSANQGYRKGAANLRRLRKKMNYNQD